MEVDIYLRFLGPGVEANPLDLWRLVRLDSVHSVLGAVSRSRQELAEWMADQVEFLMQSRELGGPDDQPQGER